MTATPYCSETDVEGRLSALGVDFRLDDGADDPAKSALLLYCREYAASRINFYCLQKYTVEALAANDWVRDRAIDISAWVLCARRANSIPKSVQLLYDEALDELKMVAAGQQIPGAPRRKASAPVLSQPRPKLFPIPNTVIERNRSTGTPENYSPRDDPLEPPFGATR